MGCISENFIVPSRGESVEFKDEDASKQPSLCWETCKAVVNASLALLGKINKEMTVKYVSVNANVFQIIFLFSSSSCKKISRKLIGNHCTSLTSEIGNLRPRRASLLAKIDCGRKDYSRSTWKNVMVAFQF